MPFSGRVCLQHFRHVATVRETGTGIRDRNERYRFGGVHRPCRTLGRPVEWIADPLGWIATRPDVTVVLLIMTVFLTGLLGMHPMISVVLLAEVVIRIGVDGLSPLAPGLALAGGWSSIICMRLAITAVVYASSIVRERPLTIGLRWNGLFGLVSILLIALIVVGRPALMS